MKSLQGQLLVASPYLEDPNFMRSVILLIQHSGEGTLGLVLNRPIDKTIQELWQDVEEAPCGNLQHVNLGGPVSGPLMAVHTEQPLGEIEIVPGVYFSAKRPFGGPGAAARRKVEALHRPLGLERGPVGERAGPRGLAGRAGYCRIHLPGGRRTLAAGEPADRCVAPGVVAEDQARAGGSVGELTNSLECKLSPELGTASTSSRPWRLLMAVRLV